MSTKGFNVLLAERIENFCTENGIDLEAELTCTSVDSSTIEAIIHSLKIGNENGLDIAEDLVLIGLNAFLHHMQTSETMQFDLKLLDY